MVTCISSIVLGYMSVLLNVHLKNDLFPILLPFLLYQGTPSLTMKKVVTFARRSWAVGFKKPQSILLYFLSGLLSNSFRLTNDVSSFYPPRTNDKHHRKTTKKNITEKQENKTIDLYISLDIT